MGMYDSINFSCPRCRQAITEQSKAGNCHLEDFSSSSVPLKIAESIDGNKLHCAACGKEWIITTPTVIHAVAMTLRAPLDGE